MQINKLFKRYGFFLRLGYNFPEEKFSFRRYALLLKMQLKENWVRHLLYTLLCVVVLTLLLVQLFSIMYDNLLSNFADDEVLYIFNYMFAFSVYIPLIISVAINAADSMPFMQSKQSKILYLLLPASNCEKFAVVLTQSIIFPILETLFALACAVVVQFISFGEPYFLTSMVSIFQDYNIVVSYLLIYTVASFVYTSAFFTLSASIFTKHPLILGFIASLVVGSVVQAVYGIFSLAYNEADISNFIYLLQYNVPNSLESLPTSLSTTFYIPHIVNMLLAIVFWIWSYRRMMRTQL